MIAPFDKLLDKFMDVLTAFDRGLKSNLEGWLKIESHLAGECHKNFKIFQLCDLWYVASIVSLLPRNFNFCTQREEAWRLHLIILMNPGSKSVILLHPHSLVEL